MVDGVSVLGTAVGVTSLGIQVCQALVRYYSDFRGFGDDIAAVITRAEGLEASIEALESIRPKIEVANSHVSKQLQQVIEACSRGLAALKAMVEKCRQVEIPVSTEEKRRLWRKRFLWPFREDTLTKLRTTLDELQANVLLAIQILELDTGRQRFDIVRSSADTLIMRSNKLEHSILEQSKSLDSVQENLRRVTYGQEREISQVSQLSLQLARIEHQLTTLIAHDAPPVPTSLSQIYEQHNETVHQSSTMGPKHQNHRKWCNCRVRKDVLYWKKLGGSFEIRTVQETEHRSDCNFSQHGQSSYKLQAQFSRYTKLFGLCVQASIAVRRISGWTSISTGFEMRRLVPETSPAFSVFHHVRCTLNCRCDASEDVLYCGCGSRVKAPLVLDDVLSSVRQGIENRRASPYDTLINGDSILHRALDLVLDMIKSGDIDTHIAWSFLCSFISSGIFDYAADDLASTLAWKVLGYAWFFEISMFDKLAYMFSLLISEFGSWSDIPFTPEPRLYVLMWQCLSYKTVLDLYDYRCSLGFAIYLRSKTELIRGLSMHESVTRTGNRTCSKRDPCYKASKLLLSSIHWPEGLRTLLSSSLVKDDNNINAWDHHKYDDFFHAIWDAVNNGDLESLDLLAYFGWPVYPAAWFFACGSGSRETLAFPTTLLSAILNWKVQRLDTPTRGKTSLDYGMASIIFNIPTRAVWNYDLDNLYHSADLSVPLANILWEAGFKEIDNLDCFFSWACNVPSTPLWIQATKYDMFSYPSLEWDLMEWFVEKGARLDWVEPILRTTPAHRIGLGFAKEACIPNRENKFMEGTSGARLLDQVLPMEHLDECFCHCSTNGCSAIGCAAKMLKDSLLHNAAPSSGGHLVLDTIAKAIESTRHQPGSFGLAVIRVLTFNELSLTHTCCMPSLEAKCDDNDKEIREIHEVERKDIDILEGLMAKFEKTWNEYHGKFHDYLEGVWKVHMEEMLVLKSVEPSTGDIESIERVGVLLCEPFGPKKLQHEPLQKKYVRPCYSELLNEENWSFRRHCFLEN